MSNTSAQPRCDGARSALAWALATVSSFALIAPAFAQSVDARANRAERDYDIPAQPLASALIRFADQSGLQVLFAQDDVAGRVSAPLRGQYAPEEALQLLLAGSDVSASIDPRGVIQLVGQRSPQDGAEFAGGALPSPSDAIGDAIVVTGTRIRGAPPAGSNLIELDGDAIDQTGRATVAEVLQTLPQNFSGSQNEFTAEGAQNAKNNLSYASSVDLRGLGADATLTLVDGRRLASAGVGNFVDISMIPLSAVERIEVLADGASATYGSDAVGGVVNIILNDAFAGAETRASYSETSNGGAHGVGASMLWGGDWTGGHLTAAYEYRQRAELDADDRRFLESSDFRPQGSNFSRTLSNPGNIIRIGATPVSYAIPAGQDGTSLSQSDLIAGALNLNELNEGSWLLPTQESQSIFLSARQEINNAITLNGDLVATTREAYLEREQLFASIIVPETNFYRQLNGLFPGQGPLTIAYFFGPDLGSVRNITRSRAYSAAIGAEITLPGSWTLSPSVTRSESREDIDNENFYDSQNIATALASSTLATAFNPFADGSNTDAAVLAGLTFDIATESEGAVSTYELAADGPLWDLPGGAMRAAFGVERRRESFAITRTENHAAGAAHSFIADPGDRTVDAVFGELYLPLVGPENSVPLVHGLTLSISARREDASDYGASTTPRAGVRWALSPQLALRASWGQSFKGPLFDQLLGGTALSYLTASGAQDPLADNGSTGVLAIAGANRDLKPERAETWTAGFDLSPGAGFRFNATYYDIDFADRIVSAGGTFAILRNPAGFESIIYRDPSPELIAQFLALGPPPFGTLPADGVEVIVDRRLTNLSGLRVRGLDLSASWGFDTGLGRFSLNAAASEMFQYETTLAAGAAPVSALDSLNNPIDFRGRLSIAWQGEDSSAALSVNYADAYRDTLSLPARRIESFSTFDFRMTHDFAGAEERGPALALTIQNLFDRDPPFANNPTGFAFDGSNASPLGRVVSLELRQRW